MIKLQYFNGKKWITISTWQNEHLAWISLGGDNYNYRTVDKKGNILTEHATRTPKKHSNP